LELVNINNWMRGNRGALALPSSGLRPCTDEKGSPTIVCANATEKLKVYFSKYAFL
jgi:hypothetical protein